MFRGYEPIKALAKECRVRVADLLVLAEKNDPFYAGLPAQRAKAEWFAALWTRFRFTTGVHLRRVHYRVVSNEVPERKHDGTPYDNTEACWDYLSEGGKYARYLGLVQTPSRTAATHLLISSWLPMACGHHQRPG